MMQSMTAFGRNRQNLDGRDITVEIRSVNSRYMDCSVRISRIWSHLEEKIKPYLISSGISRGKIDISISVDVTTNTDQFLSLDETYAASYIAALKNLRDQFGLKDDISTMSVAQNRDIFVTHKAQEDAEADWNYLKVVLDTALASFKASRQEEGARLEADMLKKLQCVKEHVSEIESISMNNIKSYRERLAERLHDMLADNEIHLDESRILTECAIFADKVAIDEEIVRLRSHFEAFDTIRKDSAPSGRKLDFLLQEMNRETNTIGSKCSDAAIAHHVVDIKNEFEKIREQIQNIE